MKVGVNGVVMGNTYPTKKVTDLPVHVKYDDLTPLRADGDRGGMSGRPLYENTVRNVKFIREHYPQMSVIACGGIDHGYKIYDLIKLGVDAVQCYSVNLKRLFRKTVSGLSPIMTPRISTPRIQRANDR